ncbi:hypothetical protein [Streptomyces showdoensis]|uniref:Uncharacterized protein n=1 Tax=Streptomyces showdoensis TaxID=68268 RepID=A0A2P2GVG0_STREW|nr:hypothetical protein VO63_05720 [Streptomyces showdoensis]
MQLLDDPVIHSALWAGGVTYVVACLVAAAGGTRAEAREMSGQLPVDGPRRIRDHFSEQSRRLSTSFGQGATNLALAVACCVMALSGPAGTIGHWLPMIFTDRQATLNSLAERLSNGSLILQLTTMAVGVTVLMRHISFLRTLFGHDGSTAELWKKLRQLLITNAQGGVFLAALTIMWLLRGHGLDGLWMTTLAYVFAFFIDDWIIISEYSIRLDVPSLTFHRWRLRLAYLCLLVPSVGLAWDAFGGWGVGVMVWYAASLFTVARSHRRGPERRRPKVPLPGQRRQEDPEATRPRSRPSS